LSYSANRKTREKQYLRQPADEVNTVSNVRVAGRIGRCSWLRLPSSLWTHARQLALVD